MNDIDDDQLFSDRALEQLVGRLLVLQICQSRESQASLTRDVCFISGNVSQGGRAIFVHIVIFPLWKTPCASMPG